MESAVSGFAGAMAGGGGGALPPASLETMALSLLLALVLGQLIAWVYQWTHSGMSYSRSFTQSLVLMTVVVSLVLFVIGDNIIIAFGLIGALALVRFRNVLKDTRDTVFIFFALILGMALGSQQYLAAIFGAVVLLLVTAYLHFTAFGTRGSFDGHLSCRLEGAPQDAGAAGLDRPLQRFCRRIKQISIRQGGGITEFIFQVRLRDRRRSDELVRTMENLAGVVDVALVLRDELAEI